MIFDWPVNRKAGESRKDSTAISARRSWPRPPTTASSPSEQLNDLFAAWAGQVANRRVHAETGQAPIERFEAGGPPRQADPGAAARGVPLVGDPQGHPHRDRPAGRQRVRRRSRAHRAPGRAALRPRGPVQPSTSAWTASPPGAAVAVHHPPPRAPRRPPGRPARARPRPGSTTSAWSPPPTTKRPGPARRSTSPGWPCSPAATQEQAVSPAPWAAHFGLARTPFGKSIPAQGPVRPARARRGDRPDQLLRRRVRRSAWSPATSARARPSALRAAVAALDPTRHQVIYIANPAFGAQGPVRHHRPGARRPAPLPQSRADGPGVRPARRRDRRAAPPRRDHRGPMPNAELCRLSWLARLESLHGRASRGGRWPNSRHSYMGWSRLSFDRARCPAGGEGDDWPHEGVRSAGGARRRVPGGAGPARLHAIVAGVQARRGGEAERLAGGPGPGRRGHLRSAGPGIPGRPGGTVRARADASSHETTVVLASRPGAGSGRPAAGTRAAR